MSHHEQTPHRRPRAVLVVAACTTLAVAVLLAATPAQAATGTYLRIARLWPGAAGADVSITSVANPALSYREPGADYGEVSAYRGIEPGVYTVSVREVGAPADSPPMLTTTLDAMAGGSYTVLGLDAPGPTLRVVGDDLAAPPPGQARLRVIPAAPAVPRLDVTVGDGPVATALEYGVPSDYRTVPSGPVTVAVSAGPDRTVTQPVDLPAGSVGTVLVLDRDGRLEVTSVVDARGPDRAPVGGVETGRGGPPVSVVALLIVGVGLAVGSAGLRPLRLPRSLRRPR